MRYMQHARKSETGIVGLVTNAENRPVGLITGASSGIGETFARRLAQRGYDLILVARREDRLHKIAASVPTHAEILPADLTTEEGLHATEQKIRNCPRLDLLVNNAGFGTLKRFWVADLAGQDAMHELHVMATMRLTHAALGPMADRGHGAVINVSSVAAFGQSEGNVSYCATKAWMNAFTLGLDMELHGAGSKVKVQALCPGFTMSEFHDTLGVDRKSIPNFMWMQADAVVDASLRGLERGEVIVIPGAIYKIAAAILRHLPYALRRRLGKPGPSGKDRRV
jgi:short-subunit dehydrogenase